MKQRKDHAAAAQKADRPADADGEQHPPVALKRAPGVREQLHRGAVDAEYDCEHAAGDARQNRARADDDTLHNAHDTVFDAGIFHIAAFLCAAPTGKAAERDAIQ